MDRRLRRVFVAVAIGSVMAASVDSVAIGQQPESHPDHMLGKNAADVTTALAATLPAGFQDQAAFTGLVHPTVVQFASDGRVFVAQKNGIVVQFDSLSDTTPTTVLDLQTRVDDYWDRGLLGFALPPDFATNPYFYVLYTYDAPIGGTAPVWNDACPSPPGPTTDGCVVSARLSRIAVGDVNGTQEQVFINDWCQQFPSHSIGTLAFGPDGALYVSGGDGANFNNADWGQWGGSAGSPTPKNPCGDPPAGVGGTEAPPSAEGGALRSQDVRTLPTGTSYAATVLSDNPISYWRLGETSGGVAIDQRAANPGSYVGGVTLGQAGAIADGDKAVALNGTSGYVSVPDAPALNLGDGPFTLEAWVNRPALGGNQEQLFDKADGGYQVNIQNNVVNVAKAGVADFAVATTQMGAGWHHIVVTKSGTTTKIYQDSVDVTGAVSNQTLTNGPGPLVIGARRGGGSAFLNGSLDDVAIYATALSASRVAAHFQAASGTGSGADPTSLDGAVLRLDPATGAAMPGNPLIGSSDPMARRIVAHGFRNPFRFTFRPATSELWVGDVGWATWEEIDLVPNPAASLSNYGWPCYEGASAQSAYDTANLTLCESLYTGGGALGPYYTYNHASLVVPGETCPTANGSSISGLAFYGSGAYPTSYNGGLFFADYTRDCIWFMPALGNGRPDTAHIATFIAGAANPVYLTIGPGGDLFYADFDGGMIHRVRYSAGNQPPTANFTAVPASGPAPLTVQFDGSSSTDPEGGALTYAWDFDGDGTDDATAAVTSHVYNTPGNYQARLRVTDIGGLSNTKTVTISVGSTPPVPTISSPAATVTWAVGDTISFSGSATDAEDGTLPASALTWNVILHHCPTDPNNCHTHPVQTFTGVASGSFQAPDHEYPSYLEIALTATDSSSLSTTTSVRIDPKTAVLSFSTTPSGLGLTAGSTSAATPFTKTVILNSSTTLGATSPQDLGGVRYAWSSWSDGGAQSHSVVTSANASYTATYQAISSDVRVTQTATTGTGTITLAFTITNGGPATATGVTLTDQLPSKLTFASATSSAGTCTYRSSDRSVICSPGSISNGLQVTISIVTTPSKGGSVSNTGSVSSTSPDLNASNNSATVTVKLR